VPDPAPLSGRLNLGYDYVDLLESGGLRAHELAVATHPSVARRAPVELPLDPAAADADLSE
jgi:hypothetical protein